MRPEWEYVPEGWARQVKGWDAPAVEASYRRRWPEFLAAVRGTGTLGIAHEVPEGRPVVTHDPGWHNVVLTFGYVLARAARGERVSVLDWGGGPGHYYALGRALLPELRIDYHSRDLPRLAALGRELLPEATFHDDDSCLEQTYDLVVASDSLQYAPEVETTLHGSPRRPPRGSSSRSYLWPREPGRSSFSSGPMHTATTPSTSAGS